MNDDREPRRRVNTAIRNVDYDYDAHLAQFDDAWYGLAVSDMALMLADDDEVRLVDPHCHEVKSGEALDVQIVLITDRLVVKSTGTLERGKPTERNTRAWARTALVGLRVRASVTAFGADFSQGAWPGGAEVTLTYSNGESVAVPSKRNDYKRRDSVEQLLPSLRDDLLDR